MTKIKTYIQFINEDIEQPDSKSLLKSIDAKRVLMGEKLDFDPDKFNDIEVLAKDAEFLQKLDKKGYKKNNVEFSKDCETFLDEGADIKFFLIFKKEDSELEPKPDFIVFQSKVKGTDRWNPIYMYEVNNNIRNFYDRLSSRTMEIKRGNKNYIYRTSNAGNDWSLQNIQDKDAEFKDIMSRDEINSAIRKPNTKMNIVS